MPTAETATALKLHIKITTSGPRSFKAIITDSGGATETVTFPFPLDRTTLDATLNEFRSKIKDIRGEPEDDDAGKVLTAKARTPRQLGNILFRTIFQGDAGKLYANNREQSRRNRQPLQTVLEIDHQLTDFINLPWEYLHDKGRGVKGGFFAFDHLTPVLRRWPGDKPFPFETDPPLRVLIVSAQPKGDERGLANLNREVEIIEKRLRALNNSGKIKVRIDHLSAATLDELKEIIRNPQKTPHIIHFIGHGQVGELFFEDREGQRATVSEDTLLITLKNAPSLRLVLLNACRTAASNPAGQLGVAQSLADAGIPAVIAMQFNISDDAAATFADEFYKVLAEGKPVDQAVTWGRIAVKDKLKGAEWGTPVFYLQTEDGDIFKDLIPQQQFPSSSVNATPSSPQPAARAKPHSPAVNSHDATLIAPATEMKRREEEEKARQIAHLQKLIETHRRRRRILQEQVAVSGEAHAEPGKLLELQDLDEKIAETEAELHQLTDAPEQPKTDAPAHSFQETQAVRPIRDLDTGAMKQITPSIRNRVTKMYDDGLTAFQQGNWGEAVKLLGNAQKLAPNLPEITIKVNHARQKWQATEEGRRTYAKAKAQYEGGMRAFKDKKWEEAAWLLEEVVKTDAGYKDAYDRAAEAKKKDETKKAEAEKQKTLKQLYTDALANEKRQNWEAAVKIWNEIVELKEDYPNARNKLTEAIRQRDMAANYRQGIATYKKKEWHNAAAAFSKVVANRKTGEYPDAEDYLGKSRHQRFLDDRIKEAEAYLENKNWAEAIKTLSENRAAEERVEGKLALDYARAQQHYAQAEWEQSAAYFKNIIAVRANYRPDVEERYAEASRQARLAQLYQQAVSAIEQSSWSEAKNLLEQIKKEDATYPGLQDKLKQVNEELYLKTKYTQAQKKLNARQWALAIPMLENILDKRREYRDTAALLDEATKQVNLESLYNRGLEAMGELNWQEAANVFRLIVEKDSQFRKAPEYLANARQKIELTRTYKQGVEALEQGEKIHDLNKLATAVGLLKTASEIDPHYQGAENKYRRAQRAHKLLNLYRNGQAAFDRAIATPHQGDWENAIIFWEKLVVDEGEPNYRVGDGDNAAQKLKEAERQKKLRNLYLDAKKAMDAKDWGQAIALFKTLTTAEDGDPNYPGAAGLLAEAELQQDLLAAFTQAQQAIEQEDWQQAIDRLTYIKHSQRPDYRKQEVEDLLGQAKENLKLETDYRQGMAATSANNWTEAVRCFERIWSTNSEYRDVEARLQQAKTELKLQTLYQEGKNALRDGKWVTAIEKFARIQEVNPNYKKAKQNLAEARKQQRLEKAFNTALEHLDAHRWEKAVPVLEKILQEDDSYRNAQTHLQKAKEEIWLFETYKQAEEEVRQEHWANAIQLLEQISQTRPGYKNVSALLENAKKQQQIRQLYDRATVLDGEGAKEQWPQALELFEQILAVDENYKDALSRKFDLEERLQQAELEKTCHQAEGILSTDDESRWDEGITRLQALLAATPDYEPAKRLLAETKRRKQNRAKELRQMADSAKNAKDWPAAITALSRLSAMRPNDAALQKELTQAKSAQKQQKQQNLQYVVGGGVIALLAICLLGAIFTKGFGVFKGGDRTPAISVTTPSPSPSPAPTEILESPTSAPAILSTKTAPPTPPPSPESTATAVLPTNTVPPKEPTNILLPEASATLTTPSGSTPTQTAIQPSPIPPSATPAPAALPPTPTAAPVLSGKIAAPSFNAKTGTYDLYVASSPDWEPHLFQQGASQPAFSPDGTQIIFRSWGGDTTPYAEQLVIRQLDNSPGRMITTHPEDGRPDWGTPGDFPVLFHSRPAGQSAHVYRLGLWNGAENDPNSRRELAVGEYPTWLADGRIVYMSGEPDGEGLYVMNADGNGIHRILATRVAPVGAPSTNRVVFSWQDDLYLLDIDGSGSPQPLLKTSNARERLPVWSPDGEYIAYVKDNNDGQWGVYVIRLVDETEIPLFELPGSIDGKPSNVPPDNAFGWYEEQLSWRR